MKYKLSITVAKLADAAAFEDLAGELGIPFNLESVESDDTKPTRSPGVGRKHHPVTPVAIAAIRNLIKQYPNDSDDKIANRARTVHKLPLYSKSTVARIRTGKHTKMKHDG